MRKREYLVFNRVDLERFADNVGADWMTAVLADTAKVVCYGRLIVRDEVSVSGWTFTASKESEKGWDMRHCRMVPCRIMTISQCGRRQNVARVADVTNRGPLEGLGVNSALLELARQSFLAISGPDPWIGGALCPVDHSNPRRLPFWERVTRQEMCVDESGSGDFLHPWHPTYNRYKAKSTLVLVSDTTSA